MRTSRLGVMARLICSQSLVYEPFHHHDEQPVANVEERVNKKEKPEKLFQLVRNFLHSITPVLIRALERAVFGHIYFVILA